MSMTRWQAWHGHYDDPGSSLSRRLSVVRRRLEEILSDGASPRRILSLCSGDGRDIIPVLARQPGESRPEAVLVEKDPVLAAAAEQRAADAGVVVTVITGDAGLTATWHSVVPVDLLMLCGIFGNITEKDIQATIGAARAVLKPGGRTIWTRGYFTDPDLRPRVREWFTAAGFTEITFDSESAGYGVGVGRLTSAAHTTGLADRIFSFIP